MRTPIMHGGKLYVYYGGTEGIHGDIYNASRWVDLKTRGENISRASSSLPNYGALCRANWTSDRLWAMATATGGPYVGTATTKDLSEERKITLAGKKVMVNAVTRKDGQLLVELLDKENKVLAGFSKDDCEPVKGDHHRKQVTWTGGKTAGKDAAKVKFYLKRVFLYGFDAVD